MSANIQQQDAGPVVSTTALIATGAVQVTAALIIIAMPAIVSALTSAGRLNAAMAGYVIAVDLAAQVAGTLVFMSQGKRLSWSTALSVGLVLMATGNLLSCFAPSTLALIGIRLIAGSGAGIVRSACMVAFARARDPARAIGLLNVAQIVGMSAAFAAFPWLARTVGWFGPYLALSIVGLLMFATAPWWPKRLQAGDGAPLSLEFGRAGVLCLIAVFVYFLAQAGIWAFVEAIGFSVGQSSASVSLALQFAAFPGVAASVLASVVGARISLRRAFVIGLSLTLASLYLLTLGSGFWIFVIGVGPFNFAWCGTTPYQFAAAAAADRRGGTAAAFPAADGLGLSAGPAIAGTLVVAHGSLTLVILAALCTTISIFLFMYCAGLPKGLARVAQDAGA